MTTTHRLMALRKLSGSTKAHVCLHPGCKTVTLDGYCKQQKCAETSHIDSVPVVKNDK